MTIYITVLFCVTAICSVCCCIANKKSCAVLCSIILILVSGFRYYVGTDYGTYAGQYIYNYSKNYEIKQIGLYIVGHLSKIIYDHYSTWFFLMATITMLFAIWGIYKHSTSIYMSLIFLIILGFWSYSFNAVKQCAATAILFCFQEYLFDKKFFKWLIICISASIFHISALLCISFYFIVQIQNFKKYISFLLILGVIIFFNANTFINIMAFLRGKSFEFESEVISRKVNVIRVMVQIVPSILYLALRNDINEDKNTSFLGKISLLNSMIYICGANSVYMLRMGIYTEIYNVLLLPTLFQSLKNEKGKRIIIYLSYLLYTAFWLVDLSKTTATSNYMWIFSRI